MSCSYQIFASWMSPELSWVCSRQHWWKNTEKINTNNATQSEFFFKRVFLSYCNKQMFHFAPPQPTVHGWLFLFSRLEMFGFNWFGGKKKKLRRRRRPAMLKASKVKNLICDIFVFCFSFEVTWLVADCTCFLSAVECTWMKRRSSATEEMCQKKPLFCSIGPPSGHFLLRGRGLLKDQLTFWPPGSTENSHFPPELCWLLWL